MTVHSHNGCAGSNKYTNKKKDNSGTRTHSDKKELFIAEQFCVHFKAKKEAVPISETASLPHVNFN